MKKTLKIVYLLTTLIFIGACESNLQEQNPVLVGEDLSDISLENGKFSFTSKEAYLFAGKNTIK